MDKIVTHPLYIKAQKVVESCDREEQYEMTRKYIMLCVRQIARKWFKKPHTLWQITDFEYGLAVCFSNLTDRLEYKCFMK